MANIITSSNTGRLDYEYCSDADDTAATVVVGYPGTRVRHTRTGGQAADDLAAGFLTGYPGTRTPRHTGSVSEDADDPAMTVLIGYPGRRVSHTRTGGQGPDDPAAGFLTGFPGIRTARQAERRHEARRLDRRLHAGSGVR